MRHPVRNFAALACFSLTTAAAVYAQGPTTADARIGLDHCPVSTCGLEIENAATFNATLRRADGESALIGFTGAAVVRAVRGVPDATAEATLGRHQMILSSATGGIGITAMVAALIISSKGSSLDLGPFLGASILGLGGTTFAVHERRVALQSFERAAWMYNSALKRPPVPAQRR